MLIKPTLNDGIVTGKYWVSSRSLEVKIKPLNPDFKFSAGQFITVHIRDTFYRAYSLAGNPNNPQELTIVVAAGHDGLGANFFREAETGLPIKFIGPSGKFVLSSESTNEMVFLATGTGLAPFVSMFYQLQNINHNDKVRVWVGLRDETEIYYRTKLEEFKDTLGDFDYTICLSQQDTIQHKKGRITQYFTIENKDTAHVYVCGNPDMVDDVFRLLDQQEIPKNHIFYEKFTHAVLR